MMLDAPRQLLQPLSNLVMVFCDSVLSNGRYRPSMFITLTCDSYGRVKDDGTPFGNSSGSLIGGGRHGC
jgi:hypothetical protein